MPAKKRENLTGSFKEFLINELKDPELASEYINAAIEDGDYRVFLMALGDVAKARGISQVSKKTGLNRENIYRIVSDRGNPQIKSVAALLDAIGLRITTKPAAKIRRPAATANFNSFHAVAGLQLGMEMSGLDFVTPEVESVSIHSAVRLPSQGQALCDLAFAA